MPRYRVCLYSLTCEKPKSELVDYNYGSLVVLSRRGEATATKCLGEMRKSETIAQPLFVDVDIPDDETEVKIGYCVLNSRGDASAALQVVRFAARITAAEKKVDVGPEIDKIEPRLTEYVQGWRETARDGLVLCFCDITSGADLAKRDQFDNDDENHTSEKYFASKYGSADACAYYLTGAMHGEDGTLHRRDVSRYKWEAVALRL